MKRSKQEMQKLFRYACFERGITMTELAKEFGVSKTALYYWINRGWVSPEIDDQFNRYVLCVHNRKDKK